MKLEGDEIMETCWHSVYTWHFSAEKSREDATNCLSDARAGTGSRVACFVASDAEYQWSPALTVHAYAYPGYEVDAFFPLVWDGFRDAVNETINRSKPDS